MPSPLKSDDHYVLVKLHNEILPWMIGGRRARKQWFVYVALIYGYGSEVFAALAGLGIGAPAIALFQGKSDGKDSLAVLREVLPGFSFWIGVAALLAWLVLRIIVNRQQVVERALFANDCSKSMVRIEVDLLQALAAPDAISKIAPLQEAVIKRVGEALDKRVWPWDPPLPDPLDAEATLELAAKVNEIRTKYMARWAPSPAGAG